MFRARISYDTLEEVVKFKAIEKEGMRLPDVAMEFVGFVAETKKECKAYVKEAYMFWVKEGILKPHCLTKLYNDIQED